MGKAGQSILWFLGACLLFSEGTIGYVATNKEKLDGGWVLLFAFLCLLTVLVALLRMFQLNPAFIMAERGDVVQLALIQQLAVGLDSAAGPRLQPGDAEAHHESKAGTLDLRRTGR